MGGMCVINHILVHRSNISFDRNIALETPVSMNKLPCHWLVVVAITCLSWLKLLELWMKGKSRCSADSNRTIFSFHCTTGIHLSILKSWLKSLGLLRISKGLINWFPFGWYQHAMLTILLKHLIRINIHLFGRTLFNIIIYDIVSIVVTFHNCEQQRQLSRLLQHCCNSNLLLSGSE
jgi:hypothetical protein